MYTLHHGDCLEILPTLPAQSVDAVITDPPYGTTACKWDSVIPFDAMWRELKRVIKPRSAIVLFGSQPFTSALVMSWPQGFRYELVWEKDNHGSPALANVQPMRYHENILVFSMGRTTYNPQMWDAGFVSNRPGRNAYLGMAGAKLQEIELRANTTYRYPKSVIRFDKPKANTGGEHPTQKPLALLEYLVKTYTDAADLVLDFTMGSGTTGEACINTGRHFIGIEKDANYYAIAERRLLAATSRLHQLEMEVA